MLRENVIRSSESESSSSFVLAPESDGFIRLCVDYRRLNAMMKRTPTPFFAWMNLSTHSQLFSELEAHLGYCKVLVSDECVPCIALVCHKRIYEYVRMPFGLKARPQYNLSSYYKWHTCLVYLYNIIVFSKTSEEHHVHLDEVLTKLSLACRRYVLRPICKLSLKEMH